MPVHTPMTYTVLFIGGPSTDFQPLGHFHVDDDGDKNVLVHVGEYTDVEAAIRGYLAQYARYDNDVVNGGPQPDEMWLVNGRVWEMR